MIRQQLDFISLFIFYGIDFNVFYYVIDRRNSDLGLVFYNIENVQIILFNDGDFFCFFINKFYLIIVFVFLVFYFFGYFYVLVKICI